MSEATTEPGIRADAARNVERILEAGRAMLRAHGPTVPFYSIAKAAGVGQATLYRHFPNKKALVRAIVDENVADLERSTTAILDAGGGFEDVLAELARSVADHGAISTLMAPEAGTEWHEEVVDRIVDILERALGRIEPAQDVRGDLDRADLRMVLEMLGGALATVDEQRRDRGERAVGLLLDGLRSERA